MLFDDLEELLSRHMALPMKSQVKFNFDAGKKSFQLSAPIYKGRKIPESIIKYVEARKERSFKPHKTSFTLDENQDVRLIQEIPFNRFQPTTRQLMIEFLALAKKCHQMLAEMAAEELNKQNR